MRRAWTATLLEIWDAGGDARTLRRDVARAADRFGETGAPSLGRDLDRALRNLARETEELSSRLSRLYGSAQDWMGPLTSDQAAQKDFLTEMLGRLQGEWRDLEARLPG